MAQEDVLVIGAGPAGLVSAYYLEKAGISYRVVDRASTVGSTWNSLYPSLRLNTTRFYSHLPEMKFPLSYGIYPSGRQYYQHVLEFAEKHQFNIQPGVTVHRVAPEEKLWRVETDEGVAHYRAVISATGVFGNPQMAKIPGIQDFKGKLIHSHDFRDPAEVKGKRVLVVGNGPSGIDIASACAETARDKVKISIRTGMDMRPRFPYGLPRQVWMMLGEHLPGNLCRVLMTKINNARYKNQEKYGIKRPVGGASSSTVPYRGPELIHAIRDGRVEPVEAPACFHEQSVELVDGSSLEVDTVIMATGYLPVLYQYLDIEMRFNPDPSQNADPCEWDIGPNGIRGWPLRDTSFHPNGRQVLGYPGLYLVGVYYKGRGAMYNFKVEAEIAAQQIKEYLATHPARSGQLLQAAR